MKVGAAACRGAAESAAAASEILRALMVTLVLLAEPIRRPLLALPVGMLHVRATAQPGALHQVFTPDLYHVERNSEAAGDHLMRVVR